MAEVLYVADDYVATDFVQTGISIDWGTKVIFVPTISMILTQTVPSKIYQLNLDDFRLALKDLEDSEDGMMFPDTHAHNPSVTVSGAILAKVVEILNGYTVTFEELDEPYRVTAVGANSNIGDKQNVNTVSLSTANSAGLQDLNSLQAASFQGGVTIDTSSSFVGTTFPIGTRGNPVNNLTDALAIAEKQGLFTINIASDLTLSTEDVSNGFNFVGNSAVINTVTLEAAANISNCTFSNLTIQGTLDNANILRECNILNITDVNGFMFQCSIAGTVVLGGGMQSTIMDCFSGVAGGGAGQTPTIDFNGTGNDLALRNYNGGITLINSTGATSTSIDMGSGRVIVDSTMTSGDITIRGIAEVTDNSTGAIVNDKTETRVGSNTLAGVNTTLGTLLGS